MSVDGAQVQSLSAIEDFRAALASFAHAAKSALESADVEVRRSVEWVSHRQLVFWKGELRRGEDAVASAKQDLHRARMSLTAFGHTPDCADQQAALAKAKARVAEAEQKIKNVQRWSLLLATEVDDYHGPARQLLAMLEGDTPRALALLDRLLRALEGYVAVKPPELASPADGGPAGETESMAQPAEARPPAEAIGQVDWAGGRESPPPPSSAG
jgi:hypothetical protein